MSLDSMSPDFLLAQVAEAERRVLKEAKRANQLAINCDWLLEQIHTIHKALCPNKNPRSWQEEAKQAAEAAVNIQKAMLALAAQDL